MAYGVSIYNTQGVDITSGVITEFVLDVLTPTATGSKSYSLNPGETLRANKIIKNSIDNFFVTNVRVSGNTILWDVTYTQYALNGMGNRIVVTKVCA